MCDNRGRLNKTIRRMLAYQAISTFNARAQLQQRAKILGYASRGQ